MATDMENRVGFGPRLGAWLIDLVIVLILAAVAAPILAGVLPGVIADAMAKLTAAQAQRGISPAAEEAARSMVAFAARFTLAIGVVSPVYYLTELLLARSPGKAILGLKIGAEAGVAASFGHLSRRFALKTGPSILSLIGTVAAVSALEKLTNILGLIFGVGCFMVLGSRRQALHDRIASTAVYRSADLAEAAAPGAPGDGALSTLTPGS